MEVILIVVLLLLVGGMVMLVAPYVIIAGMVIYMFWPALLAIALAVTLWSQGHDNLGAIVGLAGIGLVFWLSHRKAGEGSTSDPMDGKRTKYNRDGKITGYEDR